MRRTALFAVAALALSHDADLREPGPRVELAAEVAGCEKVVGVGSEETCELGPERTLRIFVPGASPARISVPPRETRPSSGGRTHTLVIPEGASFVTVQVGAAGRVVRLRSNAPRAFWVEARALRKKGDLVGARAKVSPFLAASDPIDRALAIGFEARLALAEGRVPEAIEGLRRSSALHRSLGRTSDLAEDSFALAFALNQRSRRYDEARVVLDELEPRLGGYGEGRISLPFYRAELALETGDLRTVIKGLRATLVGAERLGLVKLGRNARNLLAIVLHMQGRFAEGMKELHALDAEVERAGDATPCERSEILLNIALSIDDARSSGILVENGEIPPALERVLSACPDPHLTGLGRYVLAADALERGALADARARLAGARTSMTSPRTNDVLAFGDLEARIELASANAPKALELHAQAAAIAAASDNMRRLWLAHVGTGDVLRKTGDLDGAIAAYLRAEAVLDRGVVGLPLHEGRGALLAKSERSARAAVSALLARGEAKDVAAAFAIARRARARLLRLAASARAVEGLEPATRLRFERALAVLRKSRSDLDELARDDWKLSKDALDKARADREAKLAALRTGFDEALALVSRGADATLAAPKPDEALLLAYRTEAGFVVFVGTAATVHAFPLPASESDWPRVLGEALAPVVDAGQRVVVLPYGPLRTLDLPALKLGDAALIDRAVVSFSLDLGRLPTPDPAGGTFVVGDPTNDLPEARAEALDVARTFEVTAVLGNDATSARVLEGLSGASRLHWAGHAVFGGLDGLESRLPLASGQQIGSVEILALPRVPAHVVLSACESGRSADDDPADSLGLAQSFLVSGALDVIAPTRKVDDRVARQLSALLGTRLRAGVYAAEALALAQRDLKKTLPDADWAAFRAFTP